MVENTEINRFMGVSADMAICAGEICYDTGNNNNSKSNINITFFKRFGMMNGLFLATLS
jgi:hypothetical protein